MVGKNGRLIASTTLAWLAALSVATAAELTVTSSDDDGPGTLRAAIALAEGNGEADTIEITATGSIALASALPTISTDIEIRGPGASQLSISGGDLVRILRLSGGQVTIRDLTLADGLARGGNGNAGIMRGGGGGGGLGAGGALLSENADLTLVGVVFAGNQAHGGQGGHSVDPVLPGGSGGGAMGGASSLGPNGGNGAGSMGNGGGGGGAGGGFASGGDGGEGNIGGAGGTGGSHRLIAGLSDVGNGSGGSGAGCGGGSINFQRPGDFAGNGGIGIVNCGGNGGGGGGGAGLGGALYLRSGTLSMTDVTFTNNEARRGSGGVGGSGGGDGRGKGGALFVDRDGTVLAVSNLVRSGNIADDDAASCHDDDGVFSRGTWVQPLEPPSDISLSSTEVSEDLAAGSPVGTFSTTDPSPADAHTYALVPGDGATNNSFFQIFGDELRTVPMLDHESRPTLSLRVRTTDGCGATFERSFVITVLDVDEPPLAFDDSFDVLEDQDLIVSAPGVLDNDVDPEQVGTTVDSLITAPSHGTLVGGLAADGSFTYQPIADFNGVDTFTYQVSDGLATSNIATVTINIDSVNDAPSFSIANSVSVDQDLGPQSVAGFAFDLSPGPNNETGQTLAFSVTDNSDPGLFSEGPDLSADGTLSFTSAPGVVGTATITVLLMDDGGTDNGGQDTSTPQAFDIEIRDAVAPELVAVEATPGGIVEECAELRSPTAALVLTFSEDMADPPGDGDLGDVTNPDSYRLIAAGNDRDLSSDSCISLLDDDLLRAFESVSYDAISRQATLSFTPQLGDSLYRLVACDSLEDLASNSLSAEVATTFRQSAQNILSNGNVDCDLDSWTLASTVPEEIAYSSEDVDDAVNSGSIHVTNLSGTNFSLGQCVDSSAPTHRLGGHIRVDGAADVSVEVSLRCLLFDQANCSGSSLGEHSEAFVLSETAGQWQPIATSFATDGTASLLCSYDLSLVTGTVFDAFLDRLNLPTYIFADDFESGGISAWPDSVGTQ